MQTAKSIPVPCRAQPPARREQPLIQRSYITPLGYVGLGMAVLKIRQHHADLHGMGNHACYCLESCSRDARHQLKFASARKEFNIHDDDGLHAHNMLLIELKKLPWEASWAHAVAQLNGHRQLRGAGPAPSRANAETEWNLIGA